MGKKILLISFGDSDYDGRLRCLIEQFSKVGELSVISRGSVARTIDHHLYNGKFCGFSKAVMSYIKNKQIDYLVIDNRKACVPGLKVIKRKKPQLVIQDCRELYLMREMKRLSSIIGCYYEAKMRKKADIIISANKKRAEIMKSQLGTKRMPVVYENLRKLQYSSEQNKVAAAEKLSRYIVEGEYRIISSSGCTVSRLNDVLVQNLDKVKYKVRLFLVGDSSQQDVDTINSIIKERKLTNVEIIGRLNQDELKYLIQKSHIGIVNYNQLDTNNKYCASGKVYEFIYEGVPVVTTTNPPLMEMCTEGEIGCCDDLFFNGINEVLTNYEKFKDNVKSYTLQHTIEHNDQVFLDSLLKTIRETDPMIN